MAAAGREPRGAGRSKQPAAKLFRNQTRRAPARRKKKGLPRPTLDSAVPSLCAPSSGGAERPAAHRRGGMMKRRGGRAGGLALNLHLAPLQTAAAGASQDHHRGVDRIAMLPAKHPQFPSLALTGGGKTSEKLEEGCSRSYGHKLGHSKLQDVATRDPRKTGENKSHRASGRVQRCEVRFFQRAKEGLSKLRAMGSKKCGVEGKSGCWARRAD